jgi:hypothetical protein
MGEGIVYYFAHIGSSPVSDGSDRKLNIAWLTALGHGPIQHRVDADSSA